MNKPQIFICILMMISIQSRAQVEDCRMFIFGHSLLDHRPPAIPTPSDETTVPHWMYLLAEADGLSYTCGGQYGFLPSHDNLPPISQWGYDLVPGVWDEDNETFAEADINTTLITAANFVQYTPANMPHPVDETTTAVGSTESIFEWVEMQEPNMKFYIYENWPEMNFSSFPPTESEFETYQAETQGSFHDWWLDYQDFMMASRPEYNTRLIPTGSVISKIVMDVLDNQIPITELYEDPDPHGRANIYFLAALVSYMSVYEKKAPYDFQVPSIIHSLIQNNYIQIVDFIWSELIAFNNTDGSSRVFSNVVSEVSDVSVTNDDISLFPNPTDGYFNMTGNLSDYIIDIVDVQGLVFETIDTDQNYWTIDINALPVGIYFVRIVNSSNTVISMEKILKY